MFIFTVTVVLYSIKISRNFYRLRMTPLTSTNVFTISCLSIEPHPPNPPPPPPPPPRFGKFSSTARCKALKSLYCTIRRLFVLFVDYSRTIRTIIRLFAHYSLTIRGLFVDYSHYSLHYSSFIICRVWGGRICNEITNPCMDKCSFHTHAINSCLIINLCIRKQGIF
jgi:hypothetical protein